MNFKKLAGVLVLMMAVTTLSGCDNGKTKEVMEEAMANKVDIKITEANAVSVNDRQKMTWVQLDKQTAFNEMRELMDDELKIVKFDNGSKNGVIYIDPQGNWTGNSTLYYAFQNKEFVQSYWQNRAFTGKISEKAETLFSDISNIQTGLYAAINCYYGILPANVDGTSGLMNYISRKEAMAAICRADTPVKDFDCSKFNEIFGKDQFNFYAQQVEDCSYLKLGNKSLNPYTYNSAITRAEAVYMIVQRYFREDLSGVNIDTNPFTDLKNAGNIMERLEITTEYSPETYSLEYCLQNPKKGLPEELYKAMVVAYNHGIVGTETKWNSSVLAGDMLAMLTKAYDNMYSNRYPVNAKTGLNDGNQIETSNTSEDNSEENIISGSITSDVGDETSNESGETSDTSNGEESTSSSDVMYEEGADSSDSDVSTAESSQS